MEPEGIDQVNTDITVDKGEQYESLQLAAAYGSMEECKRFVKDVGVDANTPDLQGYLPLQWAALNNRAGVCMFLIQSGADVNATDVSTMRQTALHWAAVRGASQAAEVLLQMGANVEARDSMGYHPAHIAAQYGQTQLLSHFISQWNAEISPLDDQKRTPLHWAGYKGFADVSRLLIYLGSPLDAKDKDGCIPLHWSALQDNIDTTTILAQAGVENTLDITNDRELTPQSVAVEQGNSYIDRVIGRIREQSNSKNRRANHKLPWMRELAAVLWPYIAILVAMYNYIVILYDSAISTSLWNRVDLVYLDLVAILVFVLLYKACTAEPGYVRQGKRAEDALALRLGQWQRICASCRLVKPFRAKHCSRSGRCIEQFDHYCPWVGNAIGKKNKIFFVGFLLAASVIMTSSLVGAIYRAWWIGSHSQAAGQGYFAVIGYLFSSFGVLMAFILLNGLIILPVISLAVMQLVSVGKNFTTNENIKVLHDVNDAYGDIFQTLEFRNQRDAVNQLAPAGLGALSSEMDQLLPTTKEHVRGAWNPYDKGVYRNCIDFWTLGYHGDDCVINSKEDLSHMTPRCCSANHGNTRHGHDLEAGLGSHAR